MTMTNRALQDSCFYEYFVRDAEGFITSAISKNRDLVNGTRIRYHSIVPIDVQQKDELEQALRTAVPGDVITLTRPPAFVNVCLVDEEESVEKTQLWHNDTIVQGKVIIPILANRHRVQDHDSKTIVPGGFLYRASKVDIRSNFPLEPAFAITVHKAQGRTMEKVILAISHKKGFLCNLTYASLYVALTRVRQKSDIRLLLMGPTTHQWSTLTYLTSLKPDRALRPYFVGYEKSTSKWNEKEAYAEYKRQGN
jgi:hypothetical protein